MTTETTPVRRTQANPPPTASTGRTAAVSLLGALALFALLASPAHAQTTLSVEPITWDVIGLDSNKPDTGPSFFPVGVRVCNTGAASATNVVANFVWESANAHINTRPGTVTTLPVPPETLDLAVGACTDFYYEVAVTRTAAAYDTTRRYRIDVVADGGLTTASSPTPRQLYVEYLVSQFRNYVWDVLVRPYGETSWESIPAGGAMTLVVGQEYEIKLDAMTATNGYEQIESFINFPNTIFQILEVDTTYTAESSASMAPPYDQLYGDACVWQANPLSPAYRSCLSTGKAGGGVVVVYRVKILSVPTAPLLNPESLNTLIYDFSGSSYHYNSNYGASGRFVYVLDPEDLDLTKSFSPAAISPGGTSRLTIRIPNPTTSALSGVNFTDPLPVGMVVATPPNATTTGCGTPTFAPVAGASSFSFSYGTIPANTTCVVALDVTASGQGTYVNTTGNLFINGTTPGTGTDTGNSATATLNVLADALACTDGTMAQWTVPVGTTNPPDTTGGLPTIWAGKVTTASVAASLPDSTSIITSGYNDTSSWNTYGYKTANQTITFRLTTKNYTNVGVVFWINNRSAGNGPSSMTFDLSKDNGATWIDARTASIPRVSGWTQYTFGSPPLDTSTAGDTLFRLRPTGAANDNSGSGLDLDFITFTGCTVNPPPRITKAFQADPILVGATSQLVFTLDNTDPTGFPVPGSSPTAYYDAVALTGVNFTDNLPEGVVIDTTTSPSTTCGGSLLADDGGTTIALTGGTLAAGGTCTVSVWVRGIEPGLWENVSGYVGASESGPNITATGYAQDTIEVIAPPAISKVFAADGILTGEVTKLTFQVGNPNPEATLTGVAFTDNLPAGLVVASPSNLTEDCTPPGTASAAGSAVSLSGAELAPQASCTLSVDVLGVTVGTKLNSVTVTATETGDGNTATATLEVDELTPGIALLKQVGPSATGPWTAFLALAETEEVWYRFTVENTGDVPLTGVDVVDPAPWITALVNGCVWPATLPAADPNDDTEPPAHVATCVVGPVTAAAGFHPNLATASGQYGTTTVFDNGAAAYSTTGLTLVKLALESSYNAAGIDLHYLYGVTNTGNVALIGPIVVTDDTTSVTCPVVASLAVGEAIVCTATYTTTSGDVTAGAVTNVAYACSSDAAPVCSNEDTEIVPLAGAIDLAVTKSDGGTVVETGSEVTYTIVIRNNGPSVDNAFVSDPDVPDALVKTAVGPCTAFGGATCPANLTLTDLENGTVLIPLLPVGGGITFTVTARVDARTGPIVNTVTVTVDTATEFLLDNNSDSDENDLAINFGHLPTTVGGNTNAFDGLNLKGESGAWHLSGTTFLGYGKTTALDGIDTATYTYKATDDGVTWTPTVAWGYDEGGSLDVWVTCPVEPCYLSGWIDWNHDGDFDDSDIEGSETLFSNQLVNDELNTLTFATIPSWALLDGTTLYSRFRLSDQPMTSPSPAGQAFNGTTPLIGEIEDPFFQVIDGNVPTPVTLASFVAEREGGHTVRFAWTTATETGNVGFHLYVQDGKRLRRINEELIPSRVVDSLDRQSYEYRAEVKGEVFFIEDVSVFAEARRHGPFALGEEHGVRLADEKVAWPEIGRELAAFRRAERAGRMADKAASRAVGAPSPPLHLEVDRSGIQRVTYEALRAAGLDLAGLAPQSLRLAAADGTAVPLWASSKRLGPGTFIEFVGEALDTVYTDTNVYTLRVASGAARTIPEIGAGPGLVPVVPYSYPETFVLNRPRSYANYAPSEDAWYDTSMLAYRTPKSWEIPFQLDALADPYAAATAELVVWGVTDWPESPDHHLVAEINGVPVADELFDGLAEMRWRFEVPPGTLREGANTLRFTLPGDTGVDWDMVNFDRLEIAYARRFQAREGRLTFTGSDREYQVTGLQSPDVVVYRADRQGPQRLANVRVEAAVDGYVVTFAGQPRTATYFVSAAGALHAPAIEMPALGSELVRRADYLVIAHPAFLAGIEPLVAAREARGLAVNLVDVNDLYTAYAGGVFDPHAIAEYVAYAVANLGTRSVLLVGGDTYDYRNYLGRNSISFVPSLYGSTGPYGRFVPSDALYADVDDDGVPDVAIGRLPVRTAAELDLAVAKTLAYEEKDYGRTATFAADRRDGALSFKRINQGFMQALPADWTKEAIALDDLDVAAARAQLLAAMNRGTALVTFTGHSGPREWTFSGLFNNSHAAALTNEGRPFVAVQWGCWNTYYVDPVNTYLVHSFLFSGDRGAAAVLGAATLTDAGSEELLGRLLTPRLATQGMTLGRALQEAKTELARTHPHLADVLIGWTLMGDPELVVEP